MSIYKGSMVLGKVGEEVTPQVLRKLGRSVARLLGDTGTVVVGGDPRQSTPEMQSALIEGLMAGGCVVADVGIVPRLLVDFARRLLRAHAAVRVTGGAAAEDENGARFFFGGAPANAGHIVALRDLMEGEDLPDVQGGAVESWEEDIAEEYFAWLAKAVSATPEGRDMKIVVDAGTGAARDLAQAGLGEREGLSLEMIATEDGAPMSASGGTTPALSALAKHVKQSGADLGVLLDSDGVLVRFADDKGKPVSVDIMAVMALRGLLAETKDQKIVLDARASQLLTDDVQQASAIGVMERNGEEHLVARMVQEDAAFGVGSEGLYAFRELGGCADGLYTACRAIEMLRGCEDPLSKLRSGLRPLPSIGDITVCCTSEAIYAILNRVRGAYPRERQTEVGGVRLRLEEGVGWAAILPSEENDALTFRFEGRDQETVERIASDILNSAVEVCDEARRLAGLPALPPRGDAYGDYGVDE